MHFSEKSAIKQIGSPSPRFLLKTPGCSSRKSGQLYFTTPNEVFCEIVELAL